MHNERLAVAATLLTAAVCGSAHAQAPAAEVPVEDVRIEYRGAEGCPNAEWFLKRIRARTDRFRRVTEPASVRSFAVEIGQASGAPFVGTLAITEPPPEARTTSRRIEAPNCGEVAEGLALIAALTIDPRAKMEAALEESTPEAAPAPASKAVAPAAAAQAMPPVDHGVRPTAEQPPTGLGLHVGAGFVTSQGVAPSSELLYGAEGFLDIGSVARDRWLSPSLRLTFIRHVRHDGIDYPDQGTASFRLTTGAVDLCPVRAPLQRLDLRVCGTGEIGFLEAEGTQQQTRFWAALGARARGRFELGRFGVELSVGAEAPLRRDRYALRSEIGGVNLLVFYFGLAVSGRAN